MPNNITDTIKGNHRPHHDWPNSLNRVVICIGAQKAATSFLFTVLGQDSRVCIAPTKEVHFWDTMDGVDARRFRRRIRRQLFYSIQGKDISHIPGLDQLTLTENIKLALARHLGHLGVGFYKSFLQTHYKGEPVIFEASPGYALCRSQTFIKMANVAPDTRLIFFLRDPVERLWSASKYIWRRRLESGQASPEDVYEFFKDRITNKESLGFRHSDYHRTFSEIQAAGVNDKLTVVFQENLHLQSERDIVADTLGFCPEFNMQNKVNTHSQHFELTSDLRQNAIDALCLTYQTIHKKFNNRVPDTWLT